VPRLRWQPLVTTLLCLAGIGISTYLTITHFDKQALVCSGGGLINCEKVTTSPQSEVFGVIPVAFLGLFYFVPMMVLCLPPAWASRHRLVHLARLGGAIAGMGMVLYLISAELIQIKAICVWCSSVHLITFVLFVIIATASPTVLARGSDDEWAEEDRWDDDVAVSGTNESYQGV
jgi:uncharacterized membrane protein